MSSFVVEVLWIVSNPLLGAFSGFCFGRAVVVTVERLLRRL